MTTKRKPVVLIPADVKPLGEHPFHMVGHKYLVAVAEAADAIPLVVPAIGDLLDIAALINIADGILLTGSVSNVHPSHFDQEVHNPALPLDRARDALTLKLVQAAVKAEVPLLAICRGFQEVNVAFGGSLHQAVQEVSGLKDHREIKDVSSEIQYAHAHHIDLVPNGQLAKIIGASQMMVNSLHGQGVDRLGTGLVAEAYAPDGLVEAIRVEKAQAFTLAVQWHPEWKVMENPQYLAIFQAFGDACRFRLKRHEPPD
ncbi:MAG: gamma-glutamyl-gamma-aminobutyrate hydrolase family protein [Methylotenera sp.]|uniref:gamma-glutamyl-gamma-aminobutyrate hydrolase family protein n=1 Tax=Methylotenera sp. TaxID=2051956 RepID=UPI00248A8377|nr:gamma-glutamyl-gamma-aminobutyrate hydrolase family protein [Methylotenera sp.]MDI1308537.1 gamma-glutamyl-gamma-aminobutyrate hydrolase family protein [Methylotenera sp.]